MTTQKQTTLKELLPEHLGNRQTVRDNSSRAEDIVRIELSKIIVRPGFNVRTDYGDIGGLALSILHNGQTDPGRVDVLENGTFMLVDGHRRFEALKVLAKQGHEGLFRAFVNNSKTTEEQRILQMFTSQDNKQLLAHECAELIKRLMNLGYTQAQVAEKIGKSASYVSQMLDFANESPDIKNEVAAGNISVNTVSKLRKNIPSQTERSAAVKEAVAKSGGKKVTAESIVDTKGQKAENIVAAIEKHVGHDLFGDLRPGVVSTVKKHL